MEPTGDQPGKEGPGDEEGPPARWVPPDDRLWRHPSEMRAHPAASGGRPAVVRWARSPEARGWLVGLLSGCLGALVTALVLLASGALPTKTEIVPAATSTTRLATPVTSAGTTITSVLQSVDPSVVGVVVSGPQGEEQGSGVVVTTEGQECYVLTDSGLFTGSGSKPPVKVIAHWGYEASAHLVGVDSSAGIAVLKAVLLPAKDVSAANTGSVANVQDGEEVVAVASSSVAGTNNSPNFAIGYLGDVSSYVPPANGEANGMFSLLVAGLNVQPWEYGGALVDTNGNLLGIMSQVPGQSGQSPLTYISPIDLAMADVTAMMKGGQAASHPWLGVLDATDVSGQSAHRLGLTGAVEIESIAAGSPAEKAGIQDGDLLTWVGGHPATSVGGLISWLADEKPQEIVRVTWMSGSRRYSKNVTLGTQPPSADPS